MKIRYVFYISTCTAYYPLTLGKILSVLLLIVYIYSEHQLYCTSVTHNCDIHPTVTVSTDLIAVLLPAPGLL